MVEQKLEPVENYLHNAELAAKKFCSSITLNSKFSYDDILQEARMALLKAYSSYSFDKNTSFKTFAYIKMRGAILDYTRRALEQPLYATKERVNEINEYVAKLDSEGITKTDAEIAVDLRKDVKSVREARQLLLTNKVVDFTSCESGNDLDTATSHIYDKPSTETLDIAFTQLDVESALNKLPVKYKDILTDVYFNDMNDVQLAEKYSICKASAGNWRKKAINTFKHVYLTGALYGKSKNI